MNFFKLGRFIPLRYSLTLFLVAAGLFGVVTVAPQIFVGHRVPAEDFFGTVTLSQVE